MLIKEFRSLARDLLRADSGFAGKTAEELGVEVDALLCHGLGLNRAGLFARLNECLPSEKADEINALLKRRLALEPSAYITGHKEFYGYSFHVDPRVLIPRPETELLVDLALKRLKASSEPITVVDVGTGSGAILISLVLEMRGNLDCQRFRFFGVDLSADALEVARYNASNLFNQIIGVGSSEINVEFLLGDLLEGLSSVLCQKNCLIISNPPYIGRCDYVSPEVLQYEPHQALFAEEKGLATFKRLVDQSRSIKAHSLSLMCELADAQMEQASRILEQNGFSQIAVFRDLVGLSRVIAAQFH